MNDPQTESSTHLWFQDRAAAYLAGGLSDADAQRFTSHAAACPACAAILDDLRRADMALQSLFASAAPSADYEERLVRRVRSATAASPSRLMHIHPMVRRAAVGVAAALVVGTCGYFGSRGLHKGTLDHASSPRVVAMTTGTKEEKERTVNQLIQNVQEAIRNAKYSEALGTLDQILALDPHNDYARGVRPLVDDKFITEQQIKTHHEFDQKTGRALNSAEEQNIPYEDILRYPANWPDLSEIRDASVKSARGMEQGDSTALVYGLQGGWGGKSISDSPNHPVLKVDAAKVAAALKTRVEPEGVRNLTWRPSVTGDRDSIIEHPERQLAEAGGRTQVNARDDGDFTYSWTKTAHTKADEDEKKLRETKQLTNDFLAISGDRPTLSIESKAKLSDLSGKPAEPVYTDRYLGQKGQEQKTSGGKSGESSKSPTPADIDSGYYFQTIHRSVDTAQSNIQELSERASESTRKMTEKLEKTAAEPAVGTQNKTILIDGGDPGMSSNTGLSGTNHGYVLTSPGKDGVFGTADSIVNPDEDKDKTLAQAGTPEPVSAKPAPSAETPPPPTPTPPKAQNPIEAQAPTTAAQRRVIRNGQVQFDVDSFDSAALQVATIVGEKGGFVDTTNSEKLPNGKVQGTVIVRVPPENLDVLILNLRGIGDLKSQHISAQDVTKEYTDIESQLRAARAMEARLLDLIKEGKGQIKDLLAAEKELGVWREKIDGMEGQIRYYNNLISLSTLRVDLMERDIRAAYAALETETVNAGVETENVEQARAEALKTIDAAKGRVIESDLNKLDADQYKASIVAEVPAEKAGSVIDSLRQLGRVARMDVQRKQTTEGGAVPAAMAASLKIERKQTRFEIILYNLANVPARQTVTATLACRDVEAAYQSILAAAEAQEKSPPPGQAVARKVGRVIASSLTSQRGQVAGVLTLEVRSELAPQMDAILKNAGEVMHLAVTENVDASTVTSTKRGYTISLNSLSQVPPRETSTLSVAASDVPGLYRKLLEKLQDGKTDSRVINAELNEQDRLRVSGLLDFEIARTDLAVIDSMLGRSGESDVFERAVTRAADEQNTVDSKVRLTLRLINANDLKPRETTEARIEAADVEQAASDIAAAAQGAGGRTVERQLSKQQGGALEVRMIVDVPLAGAATVLDRLRASGTVREMLSSKNLQVPDGSLARAQFAIRLGNSQLLVSPEDSVSARFHDALKTSVKGLLFVLEYLVVGVLLIGPVALVLWGAWKMFNRARRSARKTAPSAPSNS